MKPKIKRWGSDDKRVAFHCPGCECLHSIRVESPGNEPNWEWNGSLEMPTFTPSIHVKANLICHSFVRDGNIQFLSDSTHGLAGQTVPIPDWED